MKATIGKRSLAGALAFVAKCADRRGTMPVLGCVHIAAHGDSVVLTCTDLAVAGRYVLSGDDVVVDSNGEALVDVKLLAKVVAGVSDTEVVLASDGGWLHVKSGTDRVARLAGRPTSDYPDVSKVLPGSGVPIGPGSEVLPAMRRAIHAASTDDARHNLYCVHLAPEATVATDGHRMAVVEREVAGEGKVARTIPLPVARLLVSLSDNVIVGEADGFVTAGNGQLQVGGKLALVAYPPYRAVMPARSAAKTVATVNRAELLGVLRAAMDLSEAKTRMVRLSIGDGRIAVESRNDHGELHDAVDCDVTGPSLQIAVNAGYVVEGLAACEGETVELAMQGELDPLVLRDNTGLSEVVMPCRG